MSTKAELKYKALRRAQFNLDTTFKRIDFLEKLKSEMEAFSAKQYEDLTLEQARDFADTVVNEESSELGS